VPSAARQFDRIAKLSQARGHSLTVVALDLNAGVLHGPARAAESLERRCQCVALARPARDSGYDGHRLAVSPAT